MAFLQMEVSSKVYGERHHFTYEIELELSVVDETEWVLLPDGVNGVIMTFSTSDIQTFGTVETTTNTLKTMKENPSNIIATPWTDGVINFQVQNCIFPVTAFRLVLSKGTGIVKLSARTQ